MTFDLPFKSEPLLKPRADVYPEGIFLEAWKALLLTSPEYGDGEPNEMIEHILTDLDGPLTEREASVAASFMVWLGCNAGQCFLSEAARIDGDRREAFHLSWLRTNRRRRGVNGGRRAIEYIVAGVTFRDADVVEMIVDWLGSGEGAEFLRRVQSEIEATRAAVRERNAMETRARRRAAEIENGAS